MMKSILTTVLVIATISNFSNAQTVTYDIPIGNTIGLELTSGDICTAPWATEEAKQISTGNAWGGTWVSTNAGVPTSIEIELSFSVSEAAIQRPTTLNGISNSNVDPGPAVNCAVGGVLTWSVDPLTYLPLSPNTFLVDYTGSTTINQVDNLPYAGDPYLRVTVTYGGSGAGINELTGAPIELVKITDLMGRETKFKTNTPLIYVYSDGTTRRVYQLE
jgi:hypothetical protein